MKIFEEKKLPRWSSMLDDDKWIVVSKALDILMFSYINTPLDEGTTIICHDWYSKTQQIVKSWLWL